MMHILEGKMGCIICLLVVACLAFVSLFRSRRVDTFPMQMLTWDGYSKSNGAKNVGGVDAMVPPMVYTMPTRDNMFEDYLKHQMLPHDASRIAQDPPRRYQTIGNLLMYRAFTLHRPKSGFHLRYAT